MCGIVGAIGGSDRGVIAGRIEQMKKAVRHRGPDAEGTWFAENSPVAFGHQRLSIIDLTAGSNQPMLSHDGRFAIVFNGEIYNYRELRLECEAEGARFHTHSDTEVILESYRRWGSGALKKFRGMWAFALYDIQAETVLLARDPFGIKPLYFGHFEGAFYFASEPRGLAPVDPRFSKIDAVTVKLFARHRILERGDWTFFEHVKRFPHAHFAVLSSREPTRPLQFERYWQPPAQIQKIGFNEASEELLRLLDRSVELHLRSDVPVGACLSGGLDSSAIVSLGARRLPPGSPFNTFTTRYPGHPEIDETAWAARIVRATGANAVYIEPTYASFMREFNRMIAAQGEPFGSTSIFAQYAIFQEIAKSNVRVVLDGQGADELLGGYHGFLPYFLKDRLLRNFSWAYFSETLSLRWLDNKKFPVSPLFWAKGLFKRKVASAELFASGGIRWNSEQEDSYEARMESLRLPDASFEQILVNLTTETNLPELLRYEDRNSMAHSIESRVAFLETDLVNFVLALPAELKIRRGLTKAVLRRALNGVIPDDVRRRRSKLGFPTPEVEWLQKGFNLNAETAGSEQWRNLITDMWSKSLHGNFPPI